MDVRCERCQTEYELEDASVSEEGTQVQCSACGNTFLVSRLHVPAPATEAPTSPPIAEWLLETAEGPAHRFRNLTSLQKWIIERKVTREDRISRTGHAWRRLGEIVELAPFFDVVDEADRAKAAALTARVGDGGTAVGVLKGEAARARRESPPRGSPAQPNKTAETFSEPSTSVVRMRTKIVLRLIVLLAVAGAVAYAGINELWHRRGGAIVPGFGRAEERRPPRRAMEVARPAAAAAAPVPPVTPPAPAPEPMAAAPSVAVAAPAPAPVAPAAKGETASYEKLILEGDHLLERGGRDRARKLYEQALKLRPNGVEALSGLGYVALDRGRNDRAFSYFKRAIAQSPSFGPALFGLGEAYRATGDDELALEHYRRYVTVDPKAVDVAAAERQIQTIEAKLAARASGGPLTQPLP